MDVQLYSRKGTVLQWHPRRLSERWSEIKFHQGVFGRDGERRMSAEITKRSGSIHDGDAFFLGPMECR